MAEFPVSKLKIRSALAGTATTPSARANTEAKAVGDFIFNMLAPSEMKRFLYV
jgi:hypothetical protein